MSRKRLFLLLVLGLVLLGGTLAWYTLRPAPENAALRGEIFVDLQGRPHSLTEFKGQALLVNVWAPWCAPCRAEMPMLDQLAAQARGRVQIIGIAWDRPEAVRAFLQQQPVSYPIWLINGDHALSVLQQSGNSSAGLPYSVLLDANLRTRWTNLGPIDNPQVLPRLRTLLSEFR